MLKKPIGILIVVLSFVCCYYLPTTTIRVVSQSDSVKMGDAAIGVVMLKHRVQIVAEKDAARCLGEGNTADVFTDFFSEFFGPKLQRTMQCKKAIVLKNIDPSAFREEERHFEKRDETWNIAVPIATQVFPDSINYLLVFNGIEVCPGVYYSYTGTNSSTPLRGLKTESIVSLWDIHARKEIAYGIIRCNVGSQMAVTKNTWFEVLDALARKCAEKIPLGNSEKADNR
jgi:hypothetical protein